ncbi:MAG: short chain dehydrogenase [Cyclobacteriaceae bacterium]
MKILIVGGNGTLGKTVANHFKEKHEIIIAGRSKGDFTVDITSDASISKMYQQIGKIDAMVVTAGEAKWAPFFELTPDDFNVGLQSKLMGQVNLVRLGKDFINANGSFTLTTGILADDPVMMTTSASMVNGAIHSFVKAAALELLPLGLRINAVCPGLVEDSVDKYADYFPGHDPVPMGRVANGFVKSIEGAGTGEIIRIY